MGASSSTQAKIRAARSFVSSQKSKNAVLICPPIAFIELHRHLFLRHSGAGRRGQHAKVSEEIARLSAHGILIEKAFDTRLSRNYEALFDYARENYGECHLGLADSFLAAQAAVFNHVLISFDPDFKNCLRQHNVKWYNPETRESSDPHVRRLL